MNAPETYIAEYKRFVEEVSAEKKEIVVVGAARGGWYIKQALDAAGIRIEAFLDSNTSKQVSGYHGYEVLPFESGIKKFPDAVVLIGLLDGKSVASVTSLIRNAGGDDVRFLMPSIMFYYITQLTMRNSDPEQLAHSIYQNYLPEKEKRELIVSPSLSYVLTEKCTLNCKECGAFVPDIDNPETYTVDRIVGDIRKYCSAFDLVHHIALQGGEPFLHKGLAEVIEKISTIPNLLFIDVVSNGTFVPKEAAIRSLSNHGVTVVISDYGDVSRKLAELTNACEESNIFVDYHKYTDRLWQEQHPVFPRNNSGEFNINKYARCISDKYLCCQLMDGQLHRCSFSNFTNKLKYIPDYKGDYVDLAAFEEDSTDLRDSIRKIALRRAPLQACDHCPSGEGRFLPAGIQVPRTKKQKKIRIPSS